MSAKYFLFIIYDIWLHNQQLNDITILPHSSTGS